VGWPPARLVRRSRCETIKDHQGVHPCGLCAVRRDQSKTCIEPPGVLSPRIDGEFAPNCPRGAGNPIRLVEQLERCAAAFRAYPPDASPVLNEALVRSFLDPDRALLEHRPWIRDAKRSPDDALVRESERRIVDASLQIVASMLLTN
jgi:hypothetical protein